MNGQSRIIIIHTLMTGAITAATWYVHPDSTLNSIQSALDSCANNDTVLVGPGNYHKNLVWSSVRSIKLYSESGPDTTIINGDSNGDVIWIDSCPHVDTTTVIDGFIIQNGSPNSGIFGQAIPEGSSPTIANNIITANICGVSCGFASPMIIGNTIIGNGNGINLYVSQAWIINNDISMNDGHGIAGFTSSFGTGGADVWLVKTQPDVGIMEYESPHAPPIVLQVSPNPFTHSTDIRYQTSDIGQNDTRGSKGGMPEHQQPVLRIYNVAGQLVKSFSLPTTYCLLPTAISWSGIDDANRRLPSGVYFLSLHAGSNIVRRKVLLMR